MSSLETVLWLGTQRGRDRHTAVLLIGERSTRPAHLPSSCGPATCRDRADVIAQVEGGADVLDVNMGVPMTDEPELLAKAITLVQKLTDRPVCIDSSVVEALEAGLAVYQGRALVNSITAEDDRMAAILPLVKKYDAAIIALPNDAEEIPMEADRRLELVQHIVDVATKEYGIAMADIVIDPLAMPIGADTEVVNTTMDTMRRIREVHGLNMTCGASNVSFGMPTGTPWARRSCRWR
jgi:5-methyltetrahydrofolate--homocysteine methyltransferase